VNQAPYPNTEAVNKNASVSSDMPAEAIASESKTHTAIPAVAVGKNDKTPSGISNKMENALVSYHRTQRFLGLCDLKVMALENDPEAFEEMPIRDFRNLVRCVYDLEKQAQAYAEVIYAEENPLEQNVLPNNKTASSPNGVKQSGKVEESVSSNPQKHPIFGKKHGKKFR
jgi:hypothetical protein